MTDDWQATDDSPSCAFCDVTHGRSAADVVFEDALSIAILDRRPVFPGHLLLMPRRHVPTLADLPDGDVGPLFANARTLSIAVRLAMDADGSFVAVNNRVSQSVPHLHVHVVPRRFHDGLRGFFWPRGRYPSDAEKAGVLAALRHAVDTVRPEAPGV